MQLRILGRGLFVAGAVATSSLAMLVPGASASAATTPATPEVPGSAPNAILPVVFLGASMIVIAAALYFALRYHKLLIDFMGSALKQGTTYAAEPVAATPRELMPGHADDPVPRIIGASACTPGQEMVFTISPPIRDSTGDPQQVTWSVDDKEVAGFSEGYLKYTFKKSGTSVVQAEADGAAIAPFAVHVEPVKSARPSLPFAIENWGRMVVLLFGLGIVGALMAISVLSTDAGAGLLGAMLGLGAASAGSGGGKEREKDGRAPDADADAGTGERP
ncbi:hypothetical protein [Paeniglutamicibacter cryotolerans]|uniref:Ig-like domain-containing protein n=1 Tax=Paeniglutamicibacter cryotolerans TaxID=670079 RepID=A0A839QJN0_9MICC|nr:hypothetical protein [Paeniglutamicibacter cryotolerans]MBB2995803.1 hypothetical protein [Paeniglutamicibacter cryotolerans]